ncbi:MAG: aldolase/citrate lyase family protein [Candidatus Ratteibacteria bacterium]
MSVKGIDCVFIGASDLAASMGFLKNRTHPEVEKNIKYILGVCKKMGFLAGWLPPVRR